MLLRCECGPRASSAVVFRLALTLRPGVLATATTALYARRP
jgi:hypothetical protein